MFKVSFFLLIFCSFSVFSQPWQFGKRSYSDDFYTTQQNFRLYWENKPIQKGKGYKQFRRWENFMNPRLYQGANFLSSEKLFEVWKNQKNSLKSDNDNLGKWIFQGPVSAIPYQNSTLTNGIGRVNVLIPHPTDEKILYAGTANGGLWKSINGGDSWTVQNDDLLTIGISDIAIQQSNPDVIYMATGDSEAGDSYSFGVVKSYDGGQTWDTTGLNFKISDNIFVRRILIHPTEPNVLWSATKNGIWKTENSGKNWTKTCEGNFKDIELNASNFNILYASTYGSGRANIYISTNKGNSFQRVVSGIDSTKANRIDIAVSKSNANVLYALVSKADDDGLYGIFKSTNGGSKWTQVFGVTPTYTNLLGWQKDGTDAGGQGWYDLTMVVNPMDHNDVYVGGVNIWHSLDGGSNWKIETHWYENDIPYVHADHHRLVFDYRNLSLFSCNDGGISLKKWKGEWKDISNGLEILQVYQLGLNPTNDRIICGAQDNGTNYFRNNKWECVLGGDGMYCFLDPGNVNNVYAEFYNGELKKSTDGGATFKRIGFESDEFKGAWVTPFLMHPTDRRQLFAAYSSVIKSTDEGKTWIKISNDLPGSTSEKINFMAIAPGNSKIIYVSSGSRLWFTTNDGDNWSEISNLPDNFINSITIHHSNSNEIYLTYSGFETNNKVIVSYDSGNTWSDISQGLPAIPANILVYESGTAAQMYVGTDLGVYYSNNTTKIWKRFNNGLPNVTINDLKILYKTSGNTLYAATYGRGIWSSVTLPYADFGVDTKEICVGRSVEFTDSSMGEIENYKWFFGNDAIPNNATGNLQQKVVFTEPGLKNITLTVTGVGKIDKRTKTSYINVLPENTLELYPNPTSDFLRLKFVNKVIGNARVKIFDAQGKMCYNFEFSKVQDFLISDLDLQKLSSGKYVLDFQLSETKIKKIFIKQN